MSLFGPKMVSSCPSEMLFSLTKLEPNKSTFIDKITHGNHVFGSCFIKNSECLARVNDQQDFLVSSINKLPFFQLQLVKH